MLSFRERMRANIIENGVKSSDFDDPTNDTEKIAF